MRIIKRKKGKGRKEYYYLQHSFRENSKIITKERYLGKNIPKNIERIKENFGGVLQKPLIEKLEKIKENFQKEWKKIPQSAKKRELEEIAIAFTYNTNAIEGSIITLEETREIIQSKVAPNKPMKDVEETEAHSKVFLNMLDKKEKISEKLILKWHKEIFGKTKQDIAGRYRAYPVRVGYYIAPDWQDVEKLMVDFVAFANKAKTNPVEFAARAHYKFEKIHPFGDGNGRIGRLIMNQILWGMGYSMIVIEYKNRKSYYKALEKDEEGFVTYFLKRYLSVHKNRYLRITTTKTSAKIY